MADPSRSTDDGPALVLLHGAGLDRGSWDPVIERIPGFARTLAIDLPWRADALGSTYDADVVTRLADQVAERLAALGLRRPHVVGHSLGGAVALELACRTPVAAVTSFCTIGFRTATHAPVTAAKVRAAVWLVRALGPAVCRRLFGRATFRRLAMSGLSARPAEIRAEVVAADVNSMIDSDLVALTRFAGRYAFEAPERLAGTPVNMVWAYQDRIVSLRDAERARRSLPHARHLVVIGCGHLVMRDDPDGTAAVVHACHANVMREHQRRGTR